MSPLTERLRAQRISMNGTVGAIASLAARYATVPVILTATMFCIAVSVAVVAGLAVIFERPLHPHLEFAALTAGLLAPPAALLLLELIHRLNRAERRLSNVLLSSETRFETLARISPVGIFQTDADGQCLYVNQMWCDITGMSPKEAAGQGWAKALHPGDRERVFAEWGKSVRERRPFRSEYRFLREDGSAVWVLGQAEAKRGGAGEVIGYFGTVTEITKNKEAERTLEHANRALKVVSECNQALMRITEENELLREICRIIVETGRYKMAWVGFAENDAGKTVRPAAKWGHDAGYLDDIQVTWSDLDGRRGPAAYAVHTGRPYVVKDVATDPNFTIWRKAALSRGFASLIAVPVQDGPRVTGIIGIYAPDTGAFDDEEVTLLEGLAANVAYGIRAIRNRAERARAEEAIYESEERFRATFDQAAVGMSHVAPDGTYLRVNQKFCDITGYSRSELLNLSFPEITHPDDLARDADQARRVLSGEIPTYSLEKRYIRKDGTTVWTNRTISLVRDAAGNPKYFIAVAQDITAAKRMEAQLRQAQKMEAVGQLTGGVAHDFNNLLTVVLGNLELVKDRAKDDPRMRDLAARAIAAADRGASLTQRLLAFSRKQVLQPQATDINRLVENMHDLLRRSLSETVRVETKLSANLPEVMVDPGQLEIALLNLAVNARDAMPSGGTLTIETRPARPEQGLAADSEDIPAGDCIMLSVADTGVGMAPEVRDRAFEPFFTTKDIGKGTGLGLSMVYGFVKQSGGHTEIASEPGVGTTVRIYFPCASTEALSQFDVQIPKSLAGPKEETILLVEDDSEVRHMAAAMLRDMGYRVVEAAAAKTALAVLDDGATVDLLLTDIALPGGMSGGDLAQEALRLRPGMKVLLTTGYSDHLAGLGLPAQPAHGLLQKPFHKAELAANVRRALDE
jgi:PAS domain S-box-containing protein